MILATVTWDALEARSQHQISMQLPEADYVCPAFTQLALALLPGVYLETESIVVSPRDEGATNSEQYFYSSPRSVRCTNFPSRGQS